MKEVNEGLRIQIRREEIGKMTSIEKRQVGAGVRDERKEMKKVE